MSLNTSRDAATQAANFAKLAAHPAIAALADEPRWTLVTPDKVPIDMHELKQYDRIVGCRIELPGSTTTLHEILELAPAPLGCAFYLESDLDEVCILDIEPECEPDLKAALAGSPSLYCERSLSGQGYHALMPIPDELFAKYPAIMSKKAVKANGEGWEVLFEHWVTFTADAVDAHGIDPDDDAPSPFLENLDRIAHGVQESPMRSIDYDEVGFEYIPHSRMIVDAAIDGLALAYKKTIDDFDGDYSRYEFSVAGALYRNIQEKQDKIRTVIDPDVTWSDSDDIALLSTALTECLPHRDKHDTLHGGLPLLVYTAMRLIARREEKETNS